MTLPPIRVPTPTVTTAAGGSNTEFGPWNPGIRSQIPRDLRHLCTIYRPDNVFTDVAKAEELHDLTGLDMSELVAFRPERLVLHELLIRITADFSVPDGSKIEDLGINFRQIAGAILAQYIEPHQAAISAHYHALRQNVADFVAAELALLFPLPAGSPESPPRPPRSRLRALFARDRGRAVVPDTGTDAESRVISAWAAQGESGGDALQQAAFRALAQVASALVVRHGQVWGGRDMIATLATDIACNTYGSDEIGGMIEPLLQKAAAAEHYVLLPHQERPVVMNTKGASASGKSTLRPLQKSLAGDIGVNWSEFALISPDIWRKQLLDYGTLGPAYKYGGAFTGDELQIVDQKLDRYMARKAQRGEMSHLLIDRFRFDSFAPHSNEAGSNLLTRFGHSVYLVFMITPPESLVERAWNRGLDVGRYKAVDDTLAHSIEAYSGMPQLFFTWVQRTDKRVHFEFLDNSVQLGERPRTVAFGSNDALHVLNVKCMLDIERYCKVNVDATAAEFLYNERDMLQPEKNARFLGQCVDRFREVDFADQATGRIYLRIESGSPIWVDRDALDEAIADPDTRAGLLAVAPTVFGREVAAPDRPVYLTGREHSEPFHTVGSWGTTNGSSVGAD